MPAQITVRRSLAVPLDRVALVSSEDMREIALLIRERIVRRTLSGTAVDGRPFAPYSPGYAKAKRQALGTSRVNLQVSGAMLNDMVVVDAKGWEETEGKPFATLGFVR
jgi:hypothetical protein